MKILLVSDRRLYGVKTVTVAADGSSTVSAAIDLIDSELYESEGIVCRLSDGQECHIVQSKVIPPNAVPVLRKDLPLLTKDAWWAVKAFFLKSKLVALHNAFVEAKQEKNTNAMLKVIGLLEPIYQGEE